jgi:hypothetical protein
MAERDEIVKDMSERTGKNIEKINDKAQDLIQRANLRNRMSENTITEIAHEDHENLLSQMNQRSDYLERRADNRVDRIRADQQKGGEKADEYHRASLAQMKENYVGNLIAQREAQNDALQKTRERDADRFHQQDLKTSKKLDETVANYEAKIEMIQNDSQVDKSRTVELYEKRLQEHDKAAKGELEAQAQKYEAKLAQVDEQHAKESERTERRHQEQMANFANRMKYFNNKKG